jgi:hypothetical protein
LGSRWKQKWSRNSLRQFKPFNRCRSTLLRCAQALSSSRSRQARIRHPGFSRLRLPPVQSSMPYGGSRFNGSMPCASSMFKVQGPPTSRRSNVQIVPSLGPTQTSPTGVPVVPAVPNVPTVTIVGGISKRLVQPEGDRDCLALRFFIAP